MAHRVCALSSPGNKQLQLLLVRLEVTPDYEIGSFRHVKWKALGPVWVSVPSHALTEIYALTRQMQVQMQLSSFRHSSLVF